MLSLIHSDAADDPSRVDLGGRRLIKKKKKKTNNKKIIETLNTKSSVKTEYTTRYIDYLRQNNDR